MTHKIALNFEDGRDALHPGARGRTRGRRCLSRGRQHPDGLPDGACGTCKCRCERGDYTLGSYIDDAMTEEEAAEGFVLTCQMKAQSDCVIRIPASSAACKVKAGAMAATLVEARKLSPTTIGFSVKLAESDALAFLPGQYVNVSVPGRARPAPIPSRRCRRMARSNSLSATFRAA